MGFLAQAGGAQMVIDEAQRAPELVLASKATVDRDRLVAGAVLYAGQHSYRMEPWLWALRFPNSGACTETRTGKRGRADVVGICPNRDHRWPGRHRVVPQRVV